MATTFPTTSRLSREHMFFQFTLLFVVSVAIRKFFQRLLRNKVLLAVSTYHGSCYYSNCCTSTAYLHLLCIVARTIPVRTSTPQTSLSTVTTVVVRIQAITVAPAASFTTCNSKLYIQHFNMPLETI